MKKILSFLLMFTLLIPTVLLTGCLGNKNDAKSVVNNIYYVTKVLYKGEDVSKEYTEENMRIIFYENTYMVEYSLEKNTNKYGYYIGNFTIEDNTIDLTVTEANGTYKDYQNKPEKQVSVFKSLRFSNGKLYTEFASNGAIYSFTLEKK